MLEQHSFVELQALLAQHVEGCCVFQLGCLLEEVSCDALVGVNTEAGSVHVAEVDHRVAVLKLVGVEEVFVGFFVALLNEVRNAV